MKCGDLVQFRPMNRAGTQGLYSNARMDHLAQYIEAGTKGMIISSSWIGPTGAEPDPLDEYPYVVYTILTSDGVRTPGWSESVFDLIVEGE
jgi:hypothetical protein